MGLVRRDYAESFRRNLANFWTQNLSSGLKPATKPALVRRSTPAHASQSGLWTLSGSRQGLPMPEMVLRADLPPPEKHRRRSLHLIAVQPRFSAVRCKPLRELPTPCYARA